MITNWCEYAQHVELKLWKSDSKDQKECLQITRQVSAYTKQNTILKNKLHGEAVLGNSSINALCSLKRSLKQVKKEWCNK